MIHGKLLEIQEDIGKGVAPDFHASVGAVWQAASNVTFRGNEARSTAGWTAPLTPIASNPIRGMSQKIVGGAQSLFFGDAGAIYRWNTATVASVGSGYTGQVNDTVLAPASVWSMVDWGTWVIATNGVDAPQVYKGTSFAALGGTPPTGRILQKVGAHVLLFNTSDDERGFAWCHADDVETWTPLAANTAGDLVIRELNSEIKAAVPLGPSIAVYGSDSMALVAATGNTFVFGYNMALNGIGAVSQSAVVSVGRMNYGLSVNGFWQTDGVGYHYIDSPVREYFLADVNMSQKGKIVAYHNESTTEVHWFYPSAGGSGEPDKGITYNYKTKAWSFLGFGRTSAEERIVFDYPVTADATGNVYFQNFGHNADGAALASSVTTVPLAFRTYKGASLEDRIKFVDMIKLGFTQFTAPIVLKVGVSDDLSETPAYWETRVVENPYKPIPIGLSGRWFTIIVSSNAVGAHWTLQSLVVHGKVIGGKL